MKELKNLLPVLALSVDVVAEGVEHVPSIGAAPWPPIGSSLHGKISQNIFYYWINLREKLYN